MSDVSILVIFVLFVILIYHLIAQTPETWARSKVVTILQSVFIDYEKEINALFKCSVYTLSNKMVFDVWEAYPEVFGNKANPLPTAGVVLGIYTTHDKFMGKKMGNGKKALDYDMRLLFTILGIIVIKVDNENVSGMDAVYLEEIIKCAHVVGGLRLLTDYHAQTFNNHFNKSDIPTEAEIKEFEKHYKKARKKLWKTILERQAL